MRVSRGTMISATMILLACACATVPNVISPLGAYLTPQARTGAPVPLRADPNARVILSGAEGLPTASYLPSQAARGSAVYTGTCENCHAEGQLVGQGFVQSWNNRRVYDLYALVRSTMPLDNPGGLKEGEYLDVVAYLLQANKHVSGGADSLKSDTLALRGTRIAVSVP
jgi:S-disulfanyl-L-cysteine oxidoreductase SoxD